MAFNFPAPWEGIVDFVGIESQGTETEKGHVCLVQVFGEGACVDVSFKRTQEEVWNRVPDGGSTAAGVGGRGCGSVNALRNTQFLYMSSLGTVVSFRHDSDCAPIIDDGNAAFILEFLL
jgi:hypothetical protein